jgi:pimeloyl-ACP methyl ester carboxylesterase
MTNKNNKLNYVLLIALGAGILACSVPADNASNEARSPEEFDPVSMDPPVTEPGFPPMSMGFPIDVDGSPVQFWWWHPGGQGPNPTIVLLHGSPGQERNLDLARVLQRAGFNVAAFTHRGHWGSGGFMTPTNGLDDVAAVVNWIRACSDDPECPLPIDPARIAYLAHSYGGWRAMLSIMEVPDISCAVVLDTNLGPNPSGEELRKYVAEHGDIPPEEKTWEERNTIPGARTRIERVGAWSADLLANVDRLNLMAQLDELAKKRLFVLSSSIVDHHHTLVQALEEKGAEHLRAELWEADHFFNGRRVELARAMVDYFTNDCFD